MLTEEWKQYGKKFYDLYYNQIKIICDVGGEGTLHADFRWGSLREEDHSKRIDADERIILKWIYKMWDGVRTELIWLRIRTGAGLWRIR